MNLATQTSDVDNEKTTSKSKSGLAIGIFAELPAGKNFAIQPAFLFSSLGGFDKDENFKVTAKFNYLMFPLLAKINLKPVSIYAGPQLGYLLKAKAKVEFQGQSDEGDITKDFKRMDFFAVFGTGLKLGGGLSLGINYQAGLANIFKDKSEGGSYTNDNLQVNLAWRFLK